MNIIDHLLVLNGLDQATMIAGFLLAHSANNLSYIDEVKVLTPTSICLKNKQLHPKFYTGKSHKDAVDNAKKELATNNSKCDAWAFASEGNLDADGQQIPAISVSAWSRGLTESVIFIQPFARIPRFKIEGEPIIGINGVGLNAQQSKPILIVLKKGISLHEDAGPKWDSWN